MLSLKQTFWKHWYQFLTGRVNQNPNGAPPVIFFNYGFWPPEGETLPLDPTDEHNRAAIQLYHHVASGWNLAGKNVLEVSCGHGGGASFVTRYHKPARYTAIDQNPKAIAFCQKMHDQLAIQFQTGDAQALDFPQNHFDAVLNVEASHCYPRQQDFLRSVYRVLRPGGRFLYTDFRFRTDQPQLDQDIAQAGFQVKTKTEITPHVVQALQQTTERFQALIQMLSPRLMHPIMKNFAGVEGSVVYKSFASGERQYWSYQLVKTNDLRQ
jgi:ubiquinone/menaquinone biosynthesis C-methylase UbiE